MDCEGFDEVALDLVYDDGPGSQLLEDARRHAGGCARCKASLDSLQQARQLVELPPLPVPSGLERSILAEVERQQQAHQATWWGRIDQLISLLGSFAMRPQTAMGALLVLMTGLSLVLLRAKPAERGSVRITEDGVPAAEPQPLPAASVAMAPERRPELAAPRVKDSNAGAKGQDAPEARSPREPGAEANPREIAPEAPTATAVAALAPAAPSPAAAPADREKKTEPADKVGESSQEAAFSTAMDHYKARRYGEAMRAFDVVANGGGGNGGLAALYAARSARYSSGCLAALPRFDAIANRQVGSSTATEATWETAVCYRELGQLERARQLFGTLRRVAGYRDRVEKELTALEQRNGKDAPAAAAKPGGH